MKNEAMEEKVRLFESFVETFSQFWERAAKAESYNQLVGALDIQITTASDDEKKELEKITDDLKAKRQAQIDEIFNILIKMSGKGATEYSKPCVELLYNANNAISVGFATVLSQFDDLTELFLGDLFFQFLGDKEDGDA